MSAAQGFPGSGHIGFIQKQHVDITHAEHSGRPVPPAGGPVGVVDLIPKRTPANERNAFLRKKHLQAEIFRAFDKHGTKQERADLANMVLCVRDQEWNECPQGHEGHMVKAEFCGRRICPICQARRAYLAKKKYMPALRNAMAGGYTDGEKLVFLMVTVTWPSIRGIARADISTMWDDLGRLNRQKWWKSAVEAQLWSLEFTFSVAFGHHRHAHGLIAVRQSDYDACVREYDRWVREDFRLCPALMDKPLKKMSKEKAAELRKKQAALWWVLNGPISQYTLEHAWEKMTGASVTDVRLIRPRSKDWGNQKALDAAVEEVLKYPLKETDYLADKPLRKEEIDEIDRLQGEKLDREYALVELYRAVRGRRLSDVRGCIRGEILTAMKEVEEAKSAQLLHMDDDAFEKAATCPYCGREHVETSYVYFSGRDQTGFRLIATDPLGTRTPLPDRQAKRVLDMETDREVFRLYARTAGHVYRDWVRQRRGAKKLVVSQD